MGLNTDTETKKVADFYSGRRSSKLSVDNKEVLIWPDRFNTGLHNSSN